MFDGAFAGLALPLLSSTRYRLASGHGHLYAGADGAREVVGEGVGGR